MTDTVHIHHDVVAFIRRRELSVVKQALDAMADCIALKRKIGLPVLPETRSAIEELEGQIVALKLQLLRSHHPDQMVLPGMEDLAKDAKHEANEDTSASCPDLLSTVPGS